MGALLDRSITLAQTNMNSAAKILLTFGAFAGGFVLFGVAWCIPLEPHWLNSLFAVLGVGLELGALGYIFHKIVRKLVD